MTDPTYPWFLEAFSLDTQSGGEDADIYARPDLQAVWHMDRGKELDFDPVTSLPLVCCPVCGIQTHMGALQSCPICGWEQDHSQQDVWQESAQNGGISLAEAQLNFQTFGQINPVREKEGDKEYAEF